MTARQGGHGSVAEATLAKVVQLTPQSALAWSELAWTYSSLRRPEDAAGALMRALELLPESGELWLRQAFLDEELGRTETAIAAYHRALTFLPEANRELRGAARLRLIELGGEPDPIPTHPPGQPEPSSNDLQQARELLAQGRHSSAERRVARALAIGGETPAALDLMGQTLVGQARWEPALRYFKKACALAPDEAEHWLRMADTLERLGRYEPAVRSLQKFMAASPRGHSHRDIVSQRLEHCKARLQEQAKQETAARERSHVRNHRLHLLIALVASVLVFQVVYRLVYSVAHDETGGTVQTPGAEVSTPQ